MLRLELWLKPIKAPLAQVGWPIPAEVMEPLASIKCTEESNTQWSGDFLIRPFSKQFALGQ